MIISKCLLQSHPVSLPPSAPGLSAGRGGNRSVPAHLRLVAGHLLISKAPPDAPLSSLAALFSENKSSRAYDATSPFDIPADSHNPLQSFYLSCSKGEILPAFLFHYTRNFHFHSEIRLFVTACRLLLSVKEVWCVLLSSHHHLLESSEVE